MQDHSLLSRTVLSSRIIIQNTNASGIFNFKISSSRIKNNKKKQIDFLKIQIYIANRSKILSFKHVTNTNVILYIVLFFHLSLQNLVYSTPELLTAGQTREKGRVGSIESKDIWRLLTLAPLTFWDQVPSTMINPMNYLLPKQQIIFYLKGFCCCCFYLQQVFCHEKPWLIWIPISFKDSFSSVYI